MITRLKINGFKNLVDVDIRLGAFTCIAGTNAVGKSNLFDAIRFLSDLTYKTLIDAAKSVRSEGQRNSDIRDLFHCIGNHYAERMQFEVEMIIPTTGVDDLGQSAEATITTVKYELILAYRQDDKLHTQGLLEIIKEELTPITQREAYRNIKFYSDLNGISSKDLQEIKRQENEWKKSVIQGRRSTKIPFISTEGEEEYRKVNFHQDGGSSGRPTGRKASQLPKTVLSTANALENPTALIVKNEMQSWQMLQLEPSALRKSDEFHMVANAKLGADGSHLPATLYRLKVENDKSQELPDVYQILANRLSELIEGVDNINIDKDDKRELLTLILNSKDGTQFPARALSDGTLRFLGLAVLELDSKSGGVICLEEPENGIHPEKIKAILKLLQDIATDTQRSVDKDNPLRQVIVNTHSPVVVQQVPEESLLMAELREDMDKEGNRFKKAVFSPLQGTWRTKINPTIKPVSLGKLLSYLNPVEFSEETYIYQENGKKKQKRVIDRKDIGSQLYLFNYEV